MSVIDLFAGPGGWDIAARRLGLNPHGIENNTDANNTAKAAGFNRTHADITTLTPQTCTGLIASPPCQGFSLAGKRQGRTDALALLRTARTMTPGTADQQITDLATTMADPRSILALQPLRWALQGAPDWMAWEQVTDVLPIWQAAAYTLRNHGYSVWTGTLHAEQYGVPQTRERAILIANRTTARPPTPTHSRYYPHKPHQLDAGLPRWVSMADALGYDGHVGFPRRDDNRPDALRIGTHYYRARDLRPTSLPAQAITEKARSWTFIGRPGTYDHTWPTKRPAPTIVGNFRPDILAAPGWRTKRPRQDTPGSVHITIQDAATLQTFPPDYPFQGSRTSQFLQVGNAVPPLLAQHILEAATHA